MQDVLAERFHGAQEQSLPKARVTRTTRECKELRGTSAKSLGSGRPEFSWMLAAMTYR